MADTQAQFDSLPCFLIWHYLLVQEADSRVIWIRSRLSSGILFSMELQTCNTFTQYGVSVHSFQFGVAIQPFEMELQYIHLIRCSNTFIWNGVAINSFEMGLKFIDLKLTIHSVETKYVVTIHSLYTELQYIHLKCGYNTFIWNGVAIHAFDIIWGCNTFI